MDVGTDIGGAEWTLWLDENPPGCESAAEGVGNPTPGVKDGETVGGKDVRGEESNAGGGGDESNAGERDPSGRGAVGEGNGGSEVRADEWCRGACVRDDPEEASM